MNVEKMTESEIDASRVLRAGARERMLLCHPAQLIAEALETFVRAQAAEIDIAVAANLDDALAAMESGHRFGLALWYLDGPPARIAAIAATARSLSATMPIGLLVDEATPEIVAAALAAGVAGVIPIRSPGRLVVNVLRLLLSGGTYVPPGIDASVASSTGEKGRGAHGLTGLAGLSARQTDVLRLLALGATNKNIARELGLGENTIKTHIKQIMKRLGAKNRTEAALKAAHAGLGKPAPEKLGHD
jgi:two-component system, NarL family, nitrate/nitrite response regulator NarL